MRRTEQLRVGMGIAIRKARQGRGLTLEALARLSDIDVSQLSKVERGRSGVDPATLERIGYEVGLSLPALFAAAVERSPSRKRKVA